VIDDDRAVELRAQQLGLTHLEMLALEQSEPWVKHEASRFGEGASNLRSWIDAGRPDAERDKLCVSGSPAAVKLVVAAVDKLPDAVAWHIVATTAITWIDPHLGLCGPWPRPPARPLWRIDMGFAVEERNLGLVLHEIAHAFQRDPELWRGWSSREIEELQQMVVARAGVAELTAHSNDMDRAADELASVWLGETVDTSGPRARATRLVIGGTP
jgi:hypothetical protein